MTNEAQRSEASDSTDLLGGRDWKKHPPENMEDAYLLAEALMNAAIVEAQKITGMRAWTERRPGKVIVVWEDGEITNEAEISWLQ